MATTYKADAAETGVQPRAGLHTVTRYFEFDVDTALVVDDIIQLVKIPENGRVLDFQLFLPDLDTDDTPTWKLDLGDGDDDDRYVAASTKGQSAAIVSAANDGVAGGMGHQYTADGGDTIDLHVDTAPATGATSVTIKGWVKYSVED